MIVNLYLLDCRLKLAFLNWFLELISPIQDIWIKLHCRPQKERDYLCSKRDMVTDFFMFCIYSHECGKYVLQSTLDESNWVIMLSK